MSSAKRLESFRRLLEHAHERLKLEFGFRLWDGSRVPADYPRDGLAISFADEGVVAALMRKPKIDTLANLWATARVDVVNGTLLDLVAKRPKVRTREIRGELQWGTLLGTALQFLFVPRGGPWPLENIRTDRPSQRDAVEDKDNIHYHYDASNEFYALWLDKEMVYTCAYFHDWNEDIDQAQRNKLEMVCRKLRLKPGESMLDLGCGWGGLLIYAAQKYGVSGYGVTLAEEQARYAQEKIKRLGLAGRVKVECKDYASATGSLRQGLRDLHSGARRREQFPAVLSNGAPRAEARRPVPQPVDRAAREEGRQTIPQAQRRLRRAHQIRISGRRARLYRPHHDESGALRLRGARRGSLARALRAHLQAVA